MSRCPLCHSEDSSLYSKHKTGEYRLCEICSLVFILPESYLNTEEEKARYDLHKNSPDDPNYRKFLSKVYEPVKEHIQSDAIGLDFGSGPGPTLSKMFEEAGHKINIYDLYYADNKDVLKQKYDFITSTEVVEHLYDPKTVIDTLVSMLKERGLLALLTQPYPEKEEFDNWYYKNDPTHVCFFSFDTMRWIAQKYRCVLEIIGKDIFIFRRKNVN